MGACFDIAVALASGVSISSSRILGNQDCEARLVTKPLVVKASVAQGMQVAATRMHDPLDVACRMICSVSDLAAWLRVTPEEVQWITDDMGVYFDVVSNVEWTVVID